MQEVILTSNNQVCEEAITFADINFLQWRHESQELRWQPWKLHDSSCIVDLDRRKLIPELRKLCTIRDTVGSAYDDRL